MMLDNDNAVALAATGRVFCLTAEPAVILSRVRHQTETDRPLLAGDSPAARIAELLDERREAYAQFEQVPTDGRTIGQVVADIIDRMSRSEEGSPPA